MSVGKRIKERRKQLGLSAEQVAEQMGVSPATVYRYESSEIVNMRIDKLDPIAKVLKTTPECLMGWEKKELSDIAIPVHPTHRVPILGHISAGQPLYAEEHIEGYTYTELNDGDEYFALRVHGDSMNAVRINDGDLLMVRRQDSVDDGQIAVVLVDGMDATVKRFYCSNGTVTLVPASTNTKHQIQVYDTTKTEVRVLGRVVEIKIQL